MTRPPSLSVVIPAYNAAAWLPRTLDALRRAIAHAAWPDVEIVVVDDGSTDDTAAVLAADTGTPAVTVVSQPNAGRFLARRAGLRAAHGELVLLLDSRVFPHEPSLRFLRDRLAAHPDQRVWNGDVDVDTVGNPYAGFWAAVVTLAWRRWFTDRTEAAYGLDDFDHYPKGTGFFVAPRATLLGLVDSFSATHDDWSLVSDDTHLLRGLAAEEPIRLSRQFCCTYHGRDDLRGFLRQAYYRGTTFADGHLRRESRFLAPFLALVAVSPVAALAVRRRPGLVAAGAVAGLAGLAGLARRSGARPADAEALALLTPPFAVAYGAGITRGVALRGRAAARRHAPAVARATLGLGRRAFRNTPVQQLPGVTWLYRRLGAAAFGSGTTRVQFRGATVTMPSGDITTLPSLAAGTYEADELDRFLALVQPGDTVVDVGANVGIWSVLLSRAVGPNGRVIAVEPSPGNLELLARNLADNGCENVTVVPAAAGAERGQATLDVSTDGPTHRLVAGPAATVVEVPVTTVDHLACELGLGRVDAMKVDVEGFEPAVLAGARHVLEDRPTLAVEFHAANVDALGLDWRTMLGELFERYGGATVHDGRRSVVHGPDDADRVLRSPKLLNLVFAAR